MDVQPDQDEEELKNDRQRVVSADSSDDEGRSEVTVASDEKEDFVSETVQHDEISDCMKATEEALVEQKQPGEHHQDEPPCSNNITSSEDRDAGELNTRIEQTISNEGNTVFKAKNDDGQLRPDQESQERETSNVLDETEDEAKQQSIQLHMKLLEIFRKKATTMSERHIPVPEREYNNYISIFTVLQQRLSANSETTQQQAEELKVQTQEQLEQVEKEWRAFIALKQEVAVTVWHKGKEAAQARVESVLATEQLRQDELIHLRLKHIKLNLKIRHLKTELQAIEERDSNPQHKLEIQATHSPEGKRKIEKRCELSVKVRKAMMNTKQLLPNVMEKMDRTKMEVETNKVQLAELEALTLKQRDVLTRIKQTCNKLHRDNLKLKDRCGLLENRVLLLDFEDTVNDCDCLEEKMQTLKRRQAEMDLPRGKGKKS